MSDDVILVTHRATVDYVRGVAARQGVEVSAGDGILDFRRGGEGIGSVPLDADGCVPLYAAGGVLLADKEALDARSETRPTVCP